MGAKKKRQKVPPKRATKQRAKKASSSRAVRKKAVSKKKPAKKAAAKKTRKATVKKTVKRLSTKVQPSKSAKKLGKRSKPSKRTTVKTAPALMPIAFPSPAMVAHSAAVSAARTADTKQKQQVQQSKPVRTKAALALLQRAVELGGSKALAAALDVPVRTLTKWKTAGVPKSELPSLQALVNTFAEAARHRAEVATARAGLLSQALQLATNEQGLARALLVNVSDVRRWQSLTKAGRKLPEHVLDLLGKYVGEQKIAQEKAQEARRTFEQLLRLARKKKLAPTYSDIDKKREGPRTYGWTWTRAFDRELDADAIEAVDVWLSSLPHTKGFDHWQMLAMISEYGKGKHIGYGPDPVQLGHEDEGDFVMDQQLGGRVYRKFDDARGEIIGELEDGQLEAGLFVYLHAVQVNTFSRRTDAERRAYETAARKRRAQEKASGKAVKQ